MVSASLEMPRPGFTIHRKEDAVMSSITHAIARSGPFTRPPLVFGPGIGIRLPGLSIGIY